MKACPENAILKDPETGIVLSDNEKCNGCHAEPGKSPAESGIEKQGTSSCKAACPAHINVQGYVSLALKGKFQEALQLIKEASPFPSICGRVCHHPCESDCSRSRIDEAVASRSIERFLADLDLSEKTRYKPEIKAGKEDKIAVVGSGPAGLTCAYYLAQEGYPVTIFEKADQLGGMLTMAIPSYRLPREIVEAEIELIRAMGVTFRTGVEVGRDTTVAQLRKDGFKAFFIAIGTQQCLQLGIEGEGLDGVYGGLDYLRRVNLGERPTLGKTVAVIGGGNTAIDSVRSVRRLGADNAFILYRRGLQEMPSRPEEIEECREEGIPIHTLTHPVRFIGENGRVKAIECVKMTLTEPDESGRLRPGARSRLGVHDRSRCGHHGRRPGSGLGLPDPGMRLHPESVANDERRSSDASERRSRYLRRRRRGEGPPDRYRGDCRREAGSHFHRQIYGRSGSSIEQGDRLEGDHRPPEGEG